MITFINWLIKENVSKIQNALKSVPCDGKKDGLKVWWHPNQKKAFVSVGDWAESKDWFQAVQNVIGKENVDGESESSPGEGWILIFKGRDAVKNEPNNHTA